MVSPTAFHHLADLVEAFWRNAFCHQDSRDEIAYYIINIIGTRYLL